jgi:hypothetical protein
MAKSFDDANIVTRVKTRDTEDGTVVGLFHKRSKLFEFGADDISRDGWEDSIDEFLLAKPRTESDVEAFLTSEGGDEEGEEPEGGSIVPNKYRIKYGVTQRCGDDVAEELSGFVTLPRAGKKDIDGGLDRARLRAVAEQNGLGDKLAEYEHRELNGGLLRMNISNILRGMVRRGERVQIGKRVWDAREVEKKPRKRNATKKA